MRQYQVFCFPKGFISAWECIIWSCSPFEHDGGVARYSLVDKTELFGQKC